MGDLRCSGAKECVYCPFKDQCYIYGIRFDQGERLKGRLTRPLTMPTFTLDLVEKAMGCCGERGWEEGWEI